MRRLHVALGGLAHLRDATASREIDLGAATTLTTLAGADVVRLAVSEELRPVGEDDVRDVRRACRRLELRMPPSPTLVKVALEGRPDRVVLAGEGRDGGVAEPLDLRVRGVALEPVLRPLAEAGIPVVAMIAPDLESVKRIHAEGVSGVELYTGAIVDLPDRERRAELERLGDAGRLVSKLRLGLGLGGGLAPHTLPELLEACPAADWVAVGRAALARAALVGLDRAVRDLRALVS